MRGEHPVLLGGRQPCIQGQDLGAPESAVAQGIGGVPDLAFTGEKDEDVPVAFCGEFLDRLTDGVDRVAVDECVAHLDRQGPVADFDRIGAAGDFDDGCGRAVGCCEVVREPLGVDRRRGDDHLQVRSPGQQFLEVAEDEVDVEAAFVCLVDDEGVVSAQQPIALDLGEEDAVGHQLDQGCVRHLVGEPDGVADGVAELGVEFLGDALGDRAGGDAARLRVPDQAAHPAPQFEADLRDLGGLAGPGFPGDDDDLVVADGGGDVVLALRDREVLGIGDGRRGGHPRGEPQSGLLDLGGDLRQVPGPAGPVEPPAKAMLVAQRHVGEGRLQVTACRPGRGGGVRSLA